MLSRFRWQGINNKRCAGGLLSEGMAKEISRQATKLPKTTNKTWLWSQFLPTRKNYQKFLQNIPWNYHLPLTSGSSVDLWPVNLLLLGHELETVPRRTAIYQFNVWRNNCCSSADILASIWGGTRLLTIIVRGRAERLWLLFLQNCHNPTNRDHTPIC